MSGPKSSPVLDFGLPKIQAPSLEGLEVAITAPPSPTADDLIDRLHSRLRELAPRRERGPEEGIREGDEVECDLLAMVAGRVATSSLLRSARLEMRAFPYLPGLLEGMLGMAPFSARNVDIVLGPDYPAPNLAGQQASIYVECHRVYQVSMPDLEDTEALLQANLGSNLDEAMDIVAAELESELGEAMLVNASQAVVNALADRVRDPIPEGAIEAELRQRWNAGGGALLREKAFSSQLLAKAEEDFLADPALRSEVERRIKVGLALGAIIDKEGLEPKVEVMDDLLQGAADSIGLSPDEVKAELKSHPVRARKAGETALYLTAVEFVMARATVKVVEPD